MTTLTAVNANEVEVRNNGRAVRIPILNLISIDDALVSCVKRAQAQPGIAVEMPNKQPRGCRPRNAVVYNIAQ